MTEIEENSKNPTIVTKGKVEAPHYFLIKYKNEDERIKFSDAIIRLVKRHELKDYHIEEKKAFIKNRILYNMRTINEGSELNEEELEKEFAKYIKE